jgi:ribosome maturation factor RimP
MTAAIMVFTFDVPEEKQAEYLKATTEKIKPFWESHGCESYDIWQTSNGNPAFMKIMLFKDSEAMMKSLRDYGEEAKPVVELYNSFAMNVVNKTYVKKT